MHDMLATRTSILLNEIERFKRLYPELEDDAELLADMVEGSTDFEPMMNRLAKAVISVDALREGTKAARESVAADLQAREDRFGRRGEAYRALMMMLMGSASTRKVELPAATVSIAKSRGRLVLDDDFNAQGYMRVPRPEPMRTDIAAALHNGDDIPGARLEPQPDHLTVRPR